MIENIWIMGSVTVELDYLFRRRPKKTSKPRVIGLCEENPLVTGGFPHKGPVTPIVSIWWRHHGNSFAWFQYTMRSLKHVDIDGLVPDRSNSIADLLESLQSCTNSQIAKFMGPAWGPSGADREAIDIWSEAVWLRWYFLTEIDSVLTEAIRK